VKTRFLAAIALVAALAAAGCSSDSGSGGNAPQQQQAGGTLTVWLMEGSAPDQIATAVNQEFQAAHQGVTVKYEIQKWNGILEKLTTALASNNPPDVIETGNTQTANFSKSGALLDLTSRTGELENSSDWLAGLTESGKWEGKQYGIPFYAANRLVYYRKDLFDKAGVETPTSVDDWIAVGKKVADANKSTKGFQALYLPGQNWYVAAQMIWDNGGELAVKDGAAWKGSVETPAAQAGINDYVRIFKELSKAPADTDEATPQQFEVFAKGDVAMMIGANWEANSAIGANDKLKGQVAAFPIPSHTAGQTSPVFLGGSNLSIAAGSKNQGLAFDWIKLMTGTKYETQLATVVGVLPNSSGLATKVLGSDPVLSQMAKAAQNSRVTPTDPSWAAVEANPNPLKDMMTKILSGKADVPTASKEASDLITQKMSAAG
jgi:N,N'-diacetylchitobiose transport system substrate-binding protein